MLIFRAVWTTRNPVQPAALPLRQARRAPIAVIAVIARREAPRRSGSPRSGAQWKQGIPAYNAVMAQEPMNLTHQFLIAMPALADPDFARAVVYVCEHSERGALGLVINRSTDLTLASLFDKLDLKLEIAPWKDALVLCGGPVQTDRGFVLHTPAGRYGSSLAVSEGIALTTSKDVLEAVAQGEGPGRLLVTLGHSGWGEGQLEREIAQNAWLTVGAGLEVMTRIIFDTPVQQRFDAALALLGIDAASLSGQAGHA
jgi:putative transcriptional regulator